MVDVGVASGRSGPSLELEPVRYEVVVPTVGRSTLRTLLLDLAIADGPRPERIILVDDRPDKSTPLLAVPPPRSLADLVRVLPGRARGPAAARNLGWRAGSAPWVVFLDDDVRPRREWFTHVVRDLLAVSDDVAACQGRIHVPLPRHRPPTDWERNVAGLETAQWATADMAFRRSVLEEVGGFDERFPRAYREDADLGLRITSAGHKIVLGTRVIDHPVRDADAWVSVRLQRGNADDALMRAVHGSNWRVRAGCPSGARGNHLLTTSAAAFAVAGLALGSAPAFLGFSALWAAATARFAWRRIAPGPRTLDEIGKMVVTSAAVPFAATWHFARGLLATLRTERAPHKPIPSLSAEKQRRVRAVLVDRDGTLVEDVPYNGDPALVRPLPGVKAALDRLRAAGLPIVVITNQSGVGRGYITLEQMDAVNARVEALLGPFEGFLVCPHAPGEGCACRKPEPGMVLEAARQLDVDPRECVVLGDIQADMDAARAAGAWNILVPTQVTRVDEVWSEEELAADLGTAADRVVLRARP